MPTEEKRLAKRALLMGALAALMLGGAPGCGPDTTPGSRLATTRVLGARIVAGGDPARTWPRPGEAVTVSWVVAGPRARSLAWSFRTTACAAAMDDDACAARGAVVPAISPEGGSGRGDGVSPPALAIAAPAAGADVNRLLVSGVICAGGAVGDPSAAAWSRCAPDADDGLPAVDETDVRLTVWLQLGEAGNAPPSLAGAAVTWAGDAWQSGAADSTFTSSGGPCAGDGSMPQVVRADDEERDVVVTIDGANRESIEGANDAAGDMTREQAQVSAFTTLGSFATQFGTVTSSDTRAATPVRFKWTAPSAQDAQLDPDGRVVRFVFVVRDGRGGLDATTRTLCLVPPPPKP